MPLSRLADVAVWLRLLKKSAVRWREDLSDLNLHGMNGARGHLYGPMRPQEGVSGTLAGPFASMMRNSAQWAINSEPFALKRLFQQPQPNRDIPGADMALMFVNVSTVQAN